MIYYYSLNIRLILELRTHQDKLLNPNQHVINIPDESKKNKKRN